jgi:hypothetical protein
MSAESKPYSQLYINAWTILSVVVSAIIFGMFLFGATLLHAGHWVWDLIRWICSPII